MRAWGAKLVCSNCACQTDVFDYASKEEIECCGMLMLPSMYFYTIDTAVSYGKDTLDYINRKLVWCYNHAEPVNVTFGSLQ